VVKHVHRAVLDFVAQELLPGDLAVNAQDRLARLVDRRVHGFLLGRHRHRGRGRGGAAALANSGDMAPSKMI
jgi:hypothetical protein